MDDQTSQYLIAIGDLCVAASLASLRVELRTTSGRRAAGIPASIDRPPANAADEVDDSGYPRTFRVDDQLVNLDEIVQCTINAPNDLDEATIDA